ncbi:uncharacterized protein LOC106865632 [Brachypodium distachyon]|uniref:uncharacterized protein LOC106865632 n=1 Tax=Brachypodium distachyon TaxID=15368 RepID=UPI00071CF715|nr:uncharacterized protein LOC106865632 [Brachypodium distachyon]|eukprot:XP_014751620.1 uncharacterized protein LOC106865632 [Brachypodium distachyon]
MTKYGEKGKGSGGSAEDEATPQDGGSVVVHRSGRDHNLQSTQFPMLTRSNYGEWSILMKKTAKDAWDALKSMRMGSAAVREVRAQGLCKEFEAFGFRSGETIDDRIMRLTTLVGKMADQGEVVTEGKMVRKFLRAVPRQFALVAYTMDTTIDLDTTSIEDIAGRLKGAEERLAQDGEGGAGSQLLLTEAEWRARSKCHDDDGSGSSGGSKSRGGRKRGKGKAAAKPAPPAAAGDEPAKDQYRYCGKLGHWACDCRKKKKDEAQLVQHAGGDDDEPTLLMATAAISLPEAQHVAGQVFLNEECAEAHLRRGSENCNGKWYLDSGASNHMSGDRAAFADLDENAHGKVKFGDGSLVDICGKGSVLFSIRSGEHHALTEVHYIPRLRTSIVNLGQLDENDCDMRIYRGVMTLRDRRNHLLAEKAKYRATEPLELVHADLCGPIAPATPHGNKYFMLLVDDYSQHMWLVLLPAKDAAVPAIKQYQAAAEVQSGKALRTFRTDRGGEFTSNDISMYFADNGVQRHLTAPYSPQQNGVVERRNQTIVAMARSMMKAKNVPAKFWGEAVSTTVYILNRSFTHSLDGMTPHEAWHGAKPDIHYLRTFGCVAHVKVTRPNLKKLDDRSVPMVFLGYELGSKAYRYYDPTTQ